mmetsp:Transcript_132869/g.314914  ORF Transcript_132869/g.314914 Transcript_132869/m.314914 type:complete len:258 (+) Transcript_132869:330-1103(+)
MMRSLRRYAVSIFMVKSSSLGSSCTLCTISMSARLSTSWVTLSVRTPCSPSTFPSFISFRCFSCSSWSSFSRSASSRFRSASRSSRSEASTLSSSCKNSASLQAFRFLERSTRFSSLSRSSLLRCFAEEVSAEPNSSSSLASSMALQLTALRSSSHSNSSSVLTLNTAFCDAFHFRMKASVFSSMRTLMSCPPTLLFERQVAAFHADSGSANCATPKLMALPSASVARRKAWTSPHCSSSCCICDSFKLGARCAINM